MKRILWFCIAFLFANALFGQTSNHAINSLNKTNATKSSLPQKIDNYYRDYFFNELEIFSTSNYAYNNKFQIESIITYNYSQWKTKKEMYFYNNRGLIEKVVFFSFDESTNTLDTDYVFYWFYDEFGNDTLYQMNYYYKDPNVKYKEAITKFKNKYTSNTSGVLIERIEQYWSKRLNLFRNNVKQEFDYNSTNNECIQVTYSNFDTLTNLFINDRINTDYSWYKWNGSPFNSIEKGHTYQIINASKANNLYRFQDKYDKNENLIEHNAEYWDTDSNTWELAANSSGAEEYFTQKNSIKYISNEMVEKTTQYFDKGDSIWVDYSKSTYKDFIPVNSVTKEVIYVFPNPSNGLLNIETLHKKFNRIEIFDLTGKLVYEEYYNDNQIKIDISHLNDGFYFIKTQLENGQINNTKIVLTK